MAIRNKKTRLKGMAVVRYQWFYLLVTQNEALTLIKILRKAKPLKSFFSSITEVTVDIEAQGREMAMVEVRDGMVLNEPIEVPDEKPKRIPAWTSRAKDAEAG